MAWFWSNDDSEHSSDYESYSEEDSFVDDDDETASFEEDDSETNTSASAIPISGEVKESGGTMPLSSESTVGEMAAPMANGHAKEPSVPTKDDEDVDGSLREDEFNLLVGGPEVKSTPSVPSITSNGASATKENGSLGSKAVTNGDAAAAPVDNEDEEEEEQVTTLEEKQSLLVLAAEHDRVDILQAILSSATENDNEDDRNTLLNPTESIPPPLHIAVHYGSVNAVNCLLRMGANPSVRPPAAMTKNPAVEIRDLQRFEGKTAWQLAFEEPDNNGGSFSSMFSGGTTTAPSKREGIRHAFTAEALRCVGADEVDRLQELIDSGLPVDSLVGGKTLVEWTVEMGAAKCQQLIQPDADASVSTRSSAVVRCGDSSVEALSNRLDELENLSSALSTCLDNLAEEVSVCSGLLLVGSGAAALATHVRSLKAQKEKLSTELDRLGDAWENTEDELAYWVRECGGVDILSMPTNSTSKAQTEEPPPAGQSTGSATAENADDNAAAEEASKRKLSGLIAACETKIRMLRASISDLSEENTRNLEAIGQKGLTGAVTLVRKLREEIRDLEFQLSEWKSGEAASRAKIQLLQQHHAKHGKTMALSTITESQTPGAESYDDDADDDDDAVATPSHSTAIIVRPKDGHNGFLPMNIWQLLLRIIGFNNDGGDTGAARPAIIV